MWQCGAEGPAPAARGQRAVACNARGVAVPAGKSGYGAGMVWGEGPVEVFLRRGIPPSRRSRRVGAWAREQRLRELGGAGASGPGGAVAVTVSQADRKVVAAGPA